MSRIRSLTLASASATLALLASAPLSYPQAAAQGQPQASPPAQPQLQDLPLAPSAPSALHDTLAGQSPALANAQRLVEARDFAHAESALRTLLATDSRSAPAQYLLAYALLRQGKASEALAAYTAAAALQAPSAEDLRNVAQAYVVLADYDDAGKWLERSLRMDPRSADGWYNLGRLRHTENRFADSVAAFQRALTLAPGNVKIENNLGLAYEGLNRPDDAIAAYRQAIAWQQARPSSAASEQPLLNLGIVLLHRGELTEAASLLMQAAALAPADPRIHEQLGHLRLQQADYTAARAEFTQAIALDPKNSGLHFLLGQACKHLGLTAESQAEFAAAAQLAHTTASTP